MTQPSLAEQARELAARRVLPEDRVFDRINEQRLMIEKLADELEHQAKIIQVGISEAGAISRLATALALEQQKTERLTDAVDELVEALEWAWTVICNAHNGDWTTAHSGWREAAEIFRDHYHDILAKHRPVASEEDIKFVPMAPVNESKDDEWYE